MSITVKKHMYKIVHVYSLYTIHDYTHTHTHIYIYLYTNVYSEEGKHNFKTPSDFLIFMGAEASLSLSFSLLHFLSLGKHKI